MLSSLWVNLVPFFLCSDNLVASPIYLELDLLKSTEVFRETVSLIPHTSTLASKLFQHVVSTTINKISKHLSPQCMYIYLQPVDRYYYTDAYNILLKY